MLNEIKNTLNNLTDDHSLTIGYSLLWGKFKRMGMSRNVFNVMVVAAGYETDGKSYIG